MRKRAMALTVTQEESYEESSASLALQRTLGHFAQHVNDY